MVLLLSRSFEIYSTLNNVFHKKKVKFHRCKKCVSVTTAKTHNCRKPEKLCWRLYSLNTLA